MGNLNVTTPTSSASAPATDPTWEKVLSIADAAIDKKAEHLVILDLRELSSFAEYFVICSGTSDRQVQAISDSVLSRLKAEGVPAQSAEGIQDGRWSVMDYGDVVVHVFLDALRDYYDLEKLWANAPRVKVPSHLYGTAASRLN